MTSSINSTNSLMRTYGLSGSGIDVDSMVEKLMTAARQPYNKLTQQQTLVSWRKEAYNSFYTSIGSFRNDKIYNFQMKSTLAAKTVVSSNSSAVTATANGDAAPINHSVNVLQLASGVTQTSTDKITTGTDKSTIAKQFGVSGTFSMQINGKTITVDSSKSINELVSSINKAGAGVSATYDANQDRFVIYTNGIGASTGIDYSGSSTQGLDFITNKLKLSALNNVTTSGVTSSSAIGFSDTANLAGQFAGLAGSFNLKLTMGDGTVANIAVDTTKTSLSDIINQINNIKDASGNQAAFASMDSSGKFILKAKDDANPIQLTGSDAAAISFLNNQLKLTSVVDDTAVIGSTGVSSSERVGTDLNAAIFPGNDTAFEIKISDGTNTQSVTLHYNNSMQEILNAINATGLATATFEHGKFSLKAKNSGAILDLSGSDATAQNFLTNGLLLTSQKGQDAQVKIDGVLTNQSKNSFTMAGVTYNLQSTGNASIMVQNDTEKVISSVKTFVNDYNTMLASINTKLDEKYDRNYLPLTDDQKDAMKDDDVTLWTTKAKTGLLHNDSILKTLRDSMRSAFTDAVSGIDGKYKSASSIGITTSSDWTEEGKLYVDETKLRAALEDDPDAVYKIFGTTDNSSSSTSDSSFNASRNGIATRLYKYTNTAINDIVDEAGTKSATAGDLTSVLGKQNKEYADKISTMSKKLQTLETQYYNKYSKMEEALAKLNQQTSQLSAMLGS
ncbi:flagellar filament capping protein FliD [Sporomusa acidovorans]|uniref:Flagellar hook-associated protein 2 n=1 Tax=Sporomusa acidovorans (strain ATCC 49682 / DSM 3132 / Mol) TaxID=1123286 RepID=A0ABZ3J6R0_SPOA4|nr:flagellar filament capping protein FliD [Sporomusa acidovorans]OZC19416.1 flagellar hook-associated protein 2 [Sporomusa acidovorans DSM 3132]SDD77100.1 flagellar hook-associated protein 2 [Sporomusa acidovorans]